MRPLGKSPRNLDLLGGITRLAVHAQPYRRGVRDLIIGHVGEQTVSGKWIGCCNLKLGTQRKRFRSRKRLQGGEEETTKEVYQGSRPRNAPERGKCGSLDSGEGQSMPFIAHVWPIQRWAKTEGRRSWRGRNKVSEGRWRPAHLAFSLPSSPRWDGTQL